MKSIAKRIKDLRRAANLTQIELAQKADVTQPTVSKWELGRDTPGGENLQRLATVLGVETKDIIGFGEAPDPAAGRRIMVVGQLQAGAFAETMEYAHDDQYPVSVQLDPEFDGVPVQGFEVKGPSMDKYYPDGSIVYVAPIHALDDAPRNGDHVMVMRRRADGQIEGTLKEYVSDATGRWLWPRSNHPEHQQPVDYKGKRKDIEEVQITGVVIAALVRRGRR